MKTDKEYNELWTKCMGEGYSYWEGYAHYETPTVDCRTLDPVNDMSLCWMLLDKIPHFIDIRREPTSEGLEEDIRGKWRCQIDFDGGWFYNEVLADTPQKAIIEACALALGKE